MQVRWSDLHSPVEQGKQIIGDNALDCFAVAKFQAHPQSIQLGPGKKRFALRLKIFTEIAHKINASHFSQDKIALFSIRSEQFYGFVFAEPTWIQVSPQVVAIEESHDNFLMRRRWSSHFHGTRLEGRALRVERKYVMLSVLWLSSVCLSEV
jgi:hypothetical protein